MKTNITPFGYDDKLIRVVTDETTGEPLWVAKDVCEALEYVKVDRALSKLDADEKGTQSLSTLGGEQKMSVITESGLYNLIFRSNKTEAKKFKKWVTSEVLPSIRKTGAFSVTPAQDLTPILEALYQQNMMMLQQNEMMLKLMDKMANIETSIKDVSHVQQNYIMLRQENRADYITPVQADKIVELIEDAGKYISKYHRLDMHTSKRLIFGKFNSKFAIKKYNHLKAVNFNKAVAYLTTLRDKARLQTDVTYKKMVDEIIDIFEEEE